MHTVLAVTPDKTPLGILDMNIWARPLEDHGQAKNRQKRPIEEKDSNKWLIGLRQAEAAIPEGQKLLVIGDRESDVFDVFAAPRRSTTDILVRACQNRAIEPLEDSEHRRMWDAVGATDELGRYDLDVPRQGSRAARVAHMNVRFAAVSVKQPYHRKGESLSLYAIWTKEVDVPKGVEGLEWLLLTTLPVAYAC